ncbi:hypothetical protein NLJ89_g4311 [Agrocybe chaxingu]|uniref:Uncharacterized protein n=1 Tax=Agrocybe chaxingu TaxID=84603 RepID=A0A9W8K335_9AGAR|nr:hypothetical protein NLJ89_g4311 [Agrocybe chaxingu]
MAKLYILSALLVLAAQGFALPSQEAPQTVYHCGNGVDVCPGPEWTCCGPLIEGVGGTCRKLKPDEACIF